MTDQPEDRISKGTRRAVEYIRFAELGILILVGFAIIYGMISWRNLNNNTSEKWAKIDGLIEEGHATIANLNNRINQLGGSGNDTVLEIKARLADLAPLEKNLAATAGTANREIAATAATARAQVARIGPAVDQTRAFIGHTDVSVNGDPVESLRTGRPSGLIPTATASLADFGAVASKAGLTIEKLSEDGHALLIATTPRIQALLDSGHDLIVEATGRVRELEPIEANLAGATADLHRITTDSADKYHSILFPAPVHGFWPHVKQVAEYLIKPVFEGARIYFQLTALPVRITQPIPATRP